MTPTNFNRALLAFTRRKRFRSFLLEFVTGERLPITHPESVRNEGKLFVYRGPQGDYRVFDSFSVSQLLDVTSQ